MKRALITGITGQDGYYLTKLLLSKGYEVYGLTSRSQITRYNPGEAFPRVRMIEGDLRDFASLVQAITIAEPHEIYNLGALSFVKMSFLTPQETLDVTGHGVLRMLEAVRLVGGDKNPIRFYQASSSEIFGKVHEVPQSETTLLHPRSPYGAAKALGHHLTVNYRESYGIHANSGILFNHECVPADTPVVVRRNGFVDVAAIGDLVPHRANPRSGTRYTTDGGRYEVWDGEGWSKCVARTATWHDEPIVTIHGRGGVVEATRDHVVFTAGGEAPAGEIQAGDRVRLGRQPDHTFATTLTEDEAWLLGILVAEGYVGPEGKGRVVCGDESVLAEAAACWTRVAAGSSRKTEGVPSGLGGERTPTLELSGNPGYLRMVRSELYGRDGDKRIPVRVLNAAPALQTVFLSAYNLGDGLRAGHGTDEFKSFRTSSGVLAAGLVWLARTTLGRRVSVYRQPGSVGRDSWLINLGSGSTPGRKGAHLRRPQDEVRSVERRDYRGWMCDLATESGRFAAGVGLVVVHNSPMRGLEFVTRKISNGIARIQLDKQERLQLGNLDAKRDWGFAGDYVEAMWLMLQQPEPDDYVIATGETRSVREFLDAGFRAVGIDDWEPYVEQDPRFMRPAEVDLLVGDPTKAREKLGWRPSVSFEELVRMMVEHDIEYEKTKES